MKRGRAALVIAVCLIGSPLAAAQTQPTTRVGTLWGERIRSLGLRSEE